MTTLGEELEEVPEEVDQLLLRPLCGNQEEQKEEEELGKEGAVKERKKEGAFFGLLRLLLVKIPTIILLSRYVKIVLIK